MFRSGAIRHSESEWKKNSDDENAKMTTDVILEWRNLNLTIAKSEFNIWKCRVNREEKRILDNGIHVFFFPYIFALKLKFG